MTPIPPPAAGTAPPPVIAHAVRLPVRANDPVNGEYRRLVLTAPPALLAACRAGQFFNLLCPATGAERPFLRRPMSIHDHDPDRGELHFLYKVAGSGTRGLATLVPGGQLDIFGPLGTGFHIAPEWRRLLLVARGVGLATLAPLAQQARRQGCQLTAICSARHPDLLMSVDHFRALGAKVVTVTDAEGTSGVENLGRLITERIAGAGIDAFYTCGSARILALLQDLGRRHGIPGEVALEQQMACGLGMCQCCVRPFRRGAATVQLRVCRDGPVFDLHEAMP